MNYGYLLARTRRSTALVRAIEDPVFHEIVRLVGDLAPELSSDDRRDITHDAFADACDPDQAGERFTLCGSPCPICGADAVNWAEPPDAEVVPAPPEVTHGVWHAMGEGCRREVVARALQRHGG
jgi:hypothetical protein